MPTVVVLCKNEFLEIAVPDGIEGEEYLYGTLLLHLVHQKGIIMERAKQIAEAAVYKRLYPGLVYGQQLEEDLQSLSG